MSLFKQIEKLRQQRSEALAAGDEILKKAEDEDRNLTEEESRKFDETHDAASGFQERIEKLVAQKRAEEVDFDGIEDIDSRGQPGKPKVTGETHNRAIVAWMKEQRGLEISDQERDAAKAVGVNLRAKHLDIQIAERAPGSLPELRAMTSEEGAGGGILTGVGTFVPAYEKAMLTFGGVRRVASIIRTPHGNPMTWPGGDDTGNMGYRVNEGKPKDGDDPTFKAFTMNAYKYSSGIVKVPNELLTDAGMDVAGMLGDMLGERNSRKTNLDFTLGDGANGPEGIVTGSVLGKQCTSQTAVTPEELIDLEHDVDQAYRVGAGWMCHDKFIGAIRKLKGTDRYFFQASFEGGAPGKILGYDYTVNNDMEGTLAAGNIVALFGALSKYRIRDARTVRLRRLEERYAEDDVDGFVLISSHDGGLFNPGGDPIKHLKMAAA